MSTQQTLAMTLRPHCPKNNHCSLLFKMNMVDKQRCHPLPIHATIKSFIILHHVTMPPNLDRYIKLADAPEKYKVSNTTLRRKRDNARDSGDDVTYAHFIVKTRDGEIYEQPLAELIKKLINEGKLPEWHVDHLWLQSQFGVRSNQTNPEHPKNIGHDASHPLSKEQPDEPLDTTEHRPKESEPPKNNLSPEFQVVIKAYESQIGDLQSRLDQANEERQVMRRDYQNTIDNLTKVLPASSNQASGNTSRQGTTQMEIADTIPTVQPVKTTPKKAKASSQKQPSKTKATPVRDFIFGRK